jgi:hypothetical protein
MNWPRQKGRVFLVGNFNGREKLADSVNHLLLVGFYLVNLGSVSFALRYGDKPTDAVGAMHFFNMRMLVRFRHSTLFGQLAAESVPS